MSPALRVLRKSESSLATMSIRTVRHSPHLVKQDSYNPNSGSTNASACMLADLGHYVPQQALTTQTAADRGYYVDTVGSDRQIPCQAGTYNPNNASGNASACIPASLGHYVTNPASFEQTTSRPGYYVDQIGPLQKLPVCQARIIQIVGQQTLRLACLLI